MVMTNAHLFLDDVRMPIDVEKYINPVELRPLYRLKPWIIVRNYREFTEYIKKNGLPGTISFDHDLGEDEAESMVSEGISKRKAREHKKTVKSGYDCAKWLVDYVIENELILPDILCHSMNPVGKENILMLFENYKRFMI